MATMAEAGDIVQELGYLPLALDQAGAFVRGSNLFEFLETSRTSRSRFLTDEPDGNQPYARSIQSTWTMSLDRLVVGARDFVELLAFLNADETRVEFLLTTSSELNPNLKETVSDRFLFSKALTNLQTYSLIKVLDKGRKISMHRLVQTVVRESMPIQRRRTRQLEVLNMCTRASRYSVFHIHDATSRTKFRTLLAQVMAPISCFEKDVYTLFMLGSISDCIADFLFDEALYERYGALASKMVELSKEEFGHILIRSEAS